MKFVIDSDPCVRPGLNLKGKKKKKTHTHAHTHTNTARRTALNRIFHSMQAGDISKSSHLDSHKLDGVVAKPVDPGEDPLAEEIIGVHIGLALRRHTNVRLVDAERFGGGRQGGPELKLLGGVPHDRVVARVSGGALGCLDTVGRPSGHAGALLPVAGGDCDLVARIVLNRGGSVLLVGDEEVPDAVVVLPVGVLATVPAVEISKESHPLGSGSPLGADEPRLQTRGGGALQSKFASWNSLHDTDDSFRLHLTRLDSF